MNQLENSTTVSFYRRSKVSNHILKKLILMVCDERMARREAAVRASSSLSSVAADEVSRAAAVGRHVGRRHMLSKWVLGAA